MRVKEIGVYCIKNLKNNKRYIGSSIDLPYRRIKHFSKLKHNQNHNHYLQEDYNKFGKESFIFEVLEYCKKEELIEKEQYWMDKFQSYTKEFGYNISITAGVTTHTDEVKSIMRLRAVNRKPVSEATRQKHKKRMLGNNYMLGKKHKPDVVENIRNRMFGNTFGKRNIGKKYRVKLNCEV